MDAVPGIQPQILSNITYADKVGEIIHIYEQIAYLVYDDVNENNQVIYNTYKDLDKKEKVETITGEEIKDWSSYYTYKYTFQLENGYYVFKSIELVKNKDN